MKTTLLILTTLLLLVEFGCNDDDRAAVPGEPFLNDEAIQDLEDQVHLHLPEKVCLLLATDGGGREPEAGFYEWLVYSPQSIAFSLTNGAILNDLDEFLSPAPGFVVEYMSSLVPDEYLASAKSAGIAEWTAGKYQYRADLVRTEHGDYLDIKRFRAQLVQQAP